MGRLLLAAAAGALLPLADAAAQSAMDAGVPSALVAIENEPPPKLSVDPPLAATLPQGVVLIQYRVENVRIVPVFGAGALNVSPRVGHLHIHFDGAPWLWADASNVGTIDLAGVPPGEHKVLVELVNANHQMFPGCAMCRQTVTFTVPETQSAPH
jgi:hypothetical protein